MFTFYSLVRLYSTVVDLKKCKLFELSTLDKSRGRDAAKPKLFSNQNINVMGDMHLLDQNKKFILLWSTTKLFVDHSIVRCSNQQMQAIINWT